MDAAPGDADRVDAGVLRCGDVERRVADVGGVVGVGAEPLERDEDLIRIRLAARRLVGADDEVERVAEAERLDRELDDVVALRADDPDLAALGVELLEQVEHPRERLELRVERRVVLAVGMRELVGLLRVELAHLLSRCPAPTRAISTSSGNSVPSTVFVACR